MDLFCHFGLRCEFLVQTSCVLRGCVGVAVMQHSYSYHLAQTLRPQATRFQEKRSASQHAHREHAPNDVVEKAPRANFQRVSSEDRRSPVRGQAVNQSAEMRSALEFFATAQSCREGCQFFSSSHMFIWASCRLLNLGCATGHPSFVRLFVFIHEPGSRSTWPAQRAWAA